MALTYQNQAHHSHLPLSHIITAFTKFVDCISTVRDLQPLKYCLVVTH